ncbi:MAG TPA: RsmD family RNA methyltransferase [Pirellulaceae bacterium]|nr:RsmD family RNA methyltransferase [Pirellulaceae bacterium]
MAKRRPKATPAAADEPVPTKLRIIGGRWRHRIIEYSGDLRTRPMKDRVREAVFNLVGTHAIDAHAIDLFAGTGALGLEAMSRGATSATFIERHMPTAKLIRANAAALGAGDAAQVIPTSAFIFGKRHDPLPMDRRWVVLCSPPFSFYVERRAEMLELINSLWNEAPPGSVIVIEADKTYDFTGLPENVEWDIRDYSPAVVAIAEKPQPPTE